MLSRFFYSEHDPSLLLTGVYDANLVTLSVCTAIFASFMALYLIDLASATPLHSYRRMAKVTAALIMSGGIWSMHFIGMLAFSLCTEIAYDPLVTFLSFLPAFLACLYAIHTLTHSGTLLTLVLASVLLGAGIGTMHYSGMAAMRLAPALRYDPLFFGLSIVVAVALSFIGLYTRFHLDRVFPGWSVNRRRVASAAVLGCAVSGMHYMGMVATRFVGTPEQAASDVVVDADLSFVAVSVAVTTVFLTLAVAVINGLMRYRMLLDEKTANESRLEAILSTAVDGIVTIDDKGLIASCNRAAERILGYGEKALIGQSAGVLTAGGESSGEHCTALDYGLYMQAFIGRNQEVQALHKQGHSVPLRLGVGEVLQTDLAPIYVAFISDLTEQKALQRSLVESEQRYRSLMNNLPGVAFRCRVDAHWSMLFVTPSIRELTGYDADAFITGQTHMSQLIQREDEAHIDLVIQQAIASRSAYSLEYRIRHSSGRTVWVLDQGSFTFDDHGVPQWIDGVLVDVTERYEYVDRLRQAKREAEQAAQAKQAFMANMSHEIRTPMNAIIGFSEVLLDDVLSDAQRKHLGLINSSARSLMHLLNEVLDSAKLEKGKLALESRPFSLHSLADTVVSTFSLQASQKSLALLMTLDEALAPAYIGDEARIRQVLHNLVGNAVKFTEQGSVTLSVSNVGTNQVKFDVIDTGIGIPAERLDVIFRPFEQADASTTRRFGGTGLGTTISKQLVELMGGNIDVRSVDGEGSCFSFTLPLEATDADALPVTEARLSSALPPLSLLLVDDVEQNLELLTLLLSRAGHRVRTASNGLEALAVLEKERFDAILMDVHMPECDGLEATRRLRLAEVELSKPRTPVIALTASVLHEDKLAAEQAGMDGFANKPINPRQIDAELSRLLNLSLTAESGSELDFADSDFALDDFSSPADAMVIDWQAGQALWGSEARQKQEIQRFLQAQNETVLSLAAVPDRHALSETLHNLKGLAGNLGLTTLSDTLALLEQKIDSEDAFTLLLPNVQNEWQRVYTALDEVGEWPSDFEGGKSPESTPSYDADSLLTVITTLLDDAGRGEVNEGLVEELGRIVPEAAKSLAVRIAAALEDFEFEQAGRLLEELREHVGTAPQAAATGEYS